MKKLALVGAAALGLAIPSVATAHDATVKCDTATGTYVVVADNLQRNPVYVFTDTTVTITWNNGYKVVKQLPKPCNPPTPPPPPPPAPEPPAPAPAPVPTPPELVPPDTTVVPPVPLTCAELKARYPKAGKVRLANWGCPAPPVRVKPPVKKPRYERVITCGWVLSHYTGQARANMTRKLGFPNCGRPYLPPVAG